MINTLFFGFLIGMRHALEADHVMAVTALTTSQAGPRAIWQGAAWGIGHTVTLMLIGTIFLFMDFPVPEQFAQSLEFSVGIMLLILGTDIIRQVRRNRLQCPQPSTC